MVFSSKREKKLWIGTLFVVIAIFSTLVLARQLASELRDRNLLSTGFWIGIFLVVFTVFLQGLRIKPKRAELFTWIGIAGVYFLVFLRMHVPEERSHLIEYSVLAVFIFEALKERKNNGFHVPYPSLVAWGMTSLIGFLDEVIQLAIPVRVFDWVDISFNAFAAFLAISSSTVLGWVRKKFTS